MFDWVSKRIQNKDNEVLRNCSLREEENWISLFLDDQDNQFQRCFLIKKNNKQFPFLLKLGCPKENKKSTAFLSLSVNKTLAIWYLSVMTQQWENK